MGFDLPDGLAVVAVYGFAIVVAVIGLVLALAAKAEKKRLLERVTASDKVAAKERERADVASRELQTERARLGPLTEGQLHLFAGLARSYQDLSVCRDRTQVAQALAATMARTFGCRQVMVFVATDGRGKEFELAAAGGETECGWDTGGLLNETMGRLGLVARRRAVMDAREFEAEPPIVREQLATTEPKKFVVDVAAPVVVGTTSAMLLSIGKPTLSLDAARGGMELLAAHAAAVIRGLEAVSRVERLKNTDHLTGLGSKSWFIAEGSELLYRSRSGDNAAALIMFCVDDFRPYVERVGHLTADRVLKSVGDFLRPFAPEGTLLARWNGAEFIVLVPSGTLPVAMALAERVRVAVSGSDWPLADGQPRGHLTMSAGISLFPANGQNLDELIETAAESLSAARWTGDATHLASVELLPRDAATGPRGPGQPAPR